MVAIGRILISLLCAVALTQLPTLSTAQEVLLPEVVRAVDAEGLGVASVARIYRNGTETNVDMRLRIKGLDNALNSLVTRFMTGNECGERQLGMGSRAEANPPTLNILTTLRVERWACSQADVPLFEGFPPRLTRDRRNASVTLLTKEVREYYCIGGLQAVGAFLRIAWRNCSLPPSAFSQYFTAGVDSILIKVLPEGGLFALLPKEAQQFQPILLEASMEGSDGSDFIALVRGRFSVDLDRALQVLNPGQGADKVTKAIREFVLPAVASGFSGNPTYQFQGQIYQTKVGYVSINACFSPMDGRFVPGTSKLIVKVRNGPESGSGGAVNIDTPEKVCYSVWAKNDNEDTTNAISAAIQVEEAVSNR